MAQRSGQPTTRSSEQRSSRFAFGLLLYLVLTVVVFVLVWRYMPRLGQRIHFRDAWLRFSIYFSGYLLLAVGATLVARRLPISARRERALQLSFTAGATLSFAVAFYQNRFGTGLSATYFTVGLLGAFAGVLIMTQAYFGLVEVNAPPSPEVVAAVLRGHRGVRLAGDMWDHVKRVIELLLALTFIILSLPISILLAIAIWLQDPGPLLLAKVAVTRGGRSFHLLKLRSMIRNAEQETGPVPAALNDQRITPFGRVLRKTHIDELPQMLNIARGHMSLVGPRPDRTIFAYRNLQTLPRYAERHSVRPGLAGLAAVYGDYYSTPREKLRYDLLYIRRRSFSLDLRLFLDATLLALVGIRPGQARGRRRWTERRQAERFRAAYAALHGGEPPSASPAPRPPRRSAAQFTGKRERIPDVDEPTSVG